MQDIRLTLGLVGVAVLLAMAEIIRFYVRRRRERHMQDTIDRAKRETREMTQIAVENPHPMIQVMRNGDMVFANRTALALYPDIMESGVTHPLLYGIFGDGKGNEADAREVTVGKRVYHQTIMPVSLHHGQSFVVYCYDITDRKRDEIALQQAYDMADKSRLAAESANRARGDFLANMSHELRTPMNGIIGLSDILVDADMDADHKNLAASVNDSARGLLRLLNDILDFSKIEAGELTLENIPFDMRDLVKRVTDLLSSQARAKGISLTYRVKDDVPPMLEGDSGRFQQILNNLVGNAIKFTDKGSVTIDVGGVTMHENDGIFELEINVRDTGIGIPPDKQNHIFEKFQQADVSTTRRFGGTGLGLSITRDIVTLMGGTITVQSDGKTGSTFTVRLSCAVAKAQSLKHAEMAPQETVDKNRRILIVDDHPVNLVVLERALERYGFAGIKTAASAKNALDCLGQARFDVIFMDCQMPDMDGFEATKIIRRLEKDHNQKPSIIIAVTADAMKGVRKKCVAAGMDDYISKPIDRNALHHLLVTCCGVANTQGDTDGAQENIYKLTPLMPAKNMAVFDYGILEEFTNGDDDQREDFIRMFLDNLAVDMHALQADFRHKDYKAWLGGVHKICGACSHVGANALADICNKGQNLSPDDVKGIHLLHMKIVNEYKRVNGALTGRSGKTA